VSSDSFARRSADGGEVFSFADDPKAVKTLSDRLTCDGYFMMPAGGKLDWSVNLVDVAAAVKTLKEAGWAQSFLTVYDEVWLMVHNLEELIPLVTGGNRPIGDFSVFYIDPATSGAGWPPHRDRGTEASVSAFRSDGTALYTTFWVPLTDATPSNSCLTVIPKQFDPGYSEGDNGRNPLSRIFTTPVQFQQIRALPAPAGSLIAFTHRLMHWGSAADPHSGAPPRVALAFASADDAFEPAYCSRAKHLPYPSLALRIALNAGNLLMYGQNEDPGVDLTALYWHSFSQSASEFTAAYQTRIAACKDWLDAEHRINAPVASLATAGYRQTGDHAGSTPEGTTSLWLELETSFQMSEPPNVVVDLYLLIPDWETVEVQEELWTRVLSTRDAGDASNDGYVLDILKIFSEECDKQSVEMDDSLVEVLFRRGATVKR
jgi:hypothetical protein